MTKIGKRFLFEYRCWESEESSDADLWHRTHEPVTVVGEVDLDEGSRAEVGRVWVVRFDDGYIGHVFDEELMKTSSQFQRDDYRRSRGWHNDRYRHSLAARGVRTR